MVSGNFCLAGPTVFNMFYTAVLADALHTVNDSIQVSFRSGKLFTISRFNASTKVLKELIQELLYADDGALEAHTLGLHEIHELNESFADSARRLISLSISKKVKSFNLTINIQKTSHVQPATAKLTSSCKLISMDFHLSLYQNSAILGAHYQIMH